MATATETASSVGVRSRQGLTGGILAPPGLPETCQRGEASERLARTRRVS